MDWGFGEGDGAELFGLRIFGIDQAGIYSSFCLYRGIIGSIGVRVAGTDDTGESQ